MHLRLSAAVERIRGSLFFVPLFFVMIAIACGIALLQVDSRLGDGTQSWPIGLTSTVESARALLSTVASATITFAGIAFSISLLTIQLASSQYSPRIVHTLFRDPFNKRVMGLVLGTFTYCLIVLRSVRSAIDSGGDPVIPNVSVALAVVLGIVTVLAVVAFISHSAHAMDVSQILERVRFETTRQIERERRTEGRCDVSTDDWPSGTVIRFRRGGWVQQIDTAALLELLPANGRMRIETGAGRYAIVGTPLCEVFPPSADTDELEARGRRRGRGLARQSNDAARRVLRFAPTRRRCTQGAFSGHQRPDHRPGRHLPFQCGAARRCSTTWPSRGSSRVPTAACCG